MLGTIIFLVNEYTRFVRATLICKIVKYLTAYIIK